MWVNRAKALNPVEPGKQRTNVWLFWGYPWTLEVTPTCVPLFLPCPQTSFKKK